MPKILVCDHFRANFALRGDRNIGILHLLMHGTALYLKRLLSYATFSSIFNENLGQI